METTLAHQTKAPSKGALWTGRVISGLCILFLLFDAIGKIIKEIHTIEGSARIGWPESAIQGAGLVLLISTILYIIPRTAILGAVLVTAYLGGATAISVRIAYPFVFPVVFGILVWIGLWLRNEKLRAVFPLQKD